MRYLLAEQSYEKPISAGSLRYEQDGVPTGAVEHWRWTHAMDGYRFFRVDLDARAAESGRTILFNALIRDDGVLENLRYRMYTAERRVNGQVLIERGELLNLRDVDGERFEETLDLVDELSTVLWFPSSAGLMLLWDQPAGALDTFTVHVPVENDAPAAEWFKLLARPVALEHQGEAAVVRWADQERHTVKNENGLLDRMDRQDRLSAVATRAMRYR